MLTFRPATAADLDSLFDLHRETISEYVNAEWGWNEAWQREYFEKKFDPAAFQIIRVDDVDVGVLSVERSPDVIYLALIEVTPSCQGQGIGREIVTGLLADGQLSRRPVTLHVLRTNPRARALYERLGFRIVDEEPHRYKMEWSPS